MKFAQSLSRSVSAGAHRLAMLTACALAMIFLSAGCDGPSRLDLPETDEPLYKRGQQFLRSQQNQLALESFLKLIDRRDGDAPESHFEAGRVYLSHLKDPYAAIYHFRRYLQLKPNNPQAPMVNQMIETAMKESLKGLPGTAMSAEVDRLDLLDMVQRLKGENAELRAQLDRAGIAVNTPATLAPTQNPNPGATRPAQAPPPTTVAQQARPVQPPRQQPQPAEALPVEELPVQPPVLIETLPQQTQIPPTVRQPPQRPGATTAPAPSASGRTYTVQPKDSLMAISRKVYGTPTRWREIYELNRDRMKSETDLKIGMQLRLP